jgi:hypothetical protein
MPLKRKFQLLVYVVLTVTACNLYMSMLSGIKARGSRPPPVPAPAATASKPIRPIPTGEKDKKSSQLLSFISSPRREGLEGPGGNKQQSGSSGIRAMTPQEEADDFLKILSQSTKDFHASTHADGRPITPGQVAALPLGQAKTSNEKSKALSAALAIGGGNSASSSSRESFLTDREISDSKVANKDDRVFWLAPSDLTGIRRQFPKQVS